MERVSQGLERVSLLQESQFTESAIETPQLLAITPVYVSNDVGWHKEVATMSELPVSLASVVEIEPQPRPVDDASFTPTLEFRSSEERTSDYKEFEMQPLSARMRRRIERFREFDSLVDAEIECSKEHWSELVASDSDEEARETNREVFERLTKDPEYAQFFGTDFSHIKLGPKFAEGGQAEIFEAIVSSEPGEIGESGESKDKVKYAVKVFKKGSALQDLQYQWPRGMLRSSSAAGFSVAGALQIEGGLVLDDDRFGFVLPRYWGDLRKLMDMRMQHCKTPFELSVAVDILLQVAKGMKYLHEQKIIHRDLKCSNILVRKLKPMARPRWSAPEMEPLPCGEGFNNFAAMVSVADYESSVGVVGTGFWRAPEILQQLKNGKRRPRFTAEADVYSFGMVCYEVLTGLMPFEGHPLSDYDLVLQGKRPSLLNIHMQWATELICRCWQHDPSKTPTFDTLEAELKRIKMFIDLSGFETVGRSCRSSGRNCIRWLGVYSILFVILSSIYFLVFE